MAKSFKTPLIVSACIHTVDEKTLLCFATYVNRTMWKTHTLFSLFRYIRKRSRRVADSFIPFFTALRRRSICNGNQRSICFLLLCLRSCKICAQHIPAAVQAAVLHSALRPAAPEKSARNLVHRAIYSCNKGCLRAAGCKLLRDFPQGLFARAVDPIWYDILR